MDIVEFGLPLGLAFASGLNAYLPLLAFALSVRWLHLYTINPHVAFVTQTWFIAALAILTLLDFVADKIPIIDHLWNAVHTIIRPLAGAVVAGIAISHAFPATAFLAAAGYTGSTSVIALSVLPVADSAIPITGISLLLIIILGGALAFLSHATKSLIRLVSTATTAGFLTFGLSLAEDILAVLFILLSLFAPAIMLILLAILVLVLVPRYIRTRNTWISKRLRT